MTKDIYFVLYILKKLSKASDKGDVEDNQGKTNSTLGCVPTACLKLLIYWLNMFQVDSMLQNLEKEIDDVDAKIGNHWQILDR